MQAPAETATRAVNEARQLIGRGDLPAARALLAAELATPEPSLAAFLLMAELHRESGELRDALRVLAAAADRFGNTIKLQLRRARVLYESGDVDSALDEVGAARKTHPRNGMACLLRLRWLLELQQTEEAVAEGDAMLDNPELPPETLRYWVLAALRCGATARIVARRGRLAALFPADAVQVALMAAGAGDAEIASAGVQALSVDAREDGQRYARCLAVHGQGAAALAFIARVRPLYPQAGELAYLEQIARLSVDGATLADSAQDLASGDVVPDPQELARMTQLLSLVGASHDAHDAMVRALQQVREPQARSLRALELAELLFSRDDTARARELAAAVDPSEMKRRDHLRYLRLSGALGVAAPKASATPLAIEPDELLEDGWLRHYRFGSERCLVWFGGINAFAEAARQQRWLPFWKAAGVSVLTVQDHRRMASMAGFGRYFPHRADAEKALAGLLPGLGYRQWVCGGASLAGASAIFYGAHLRAAGLLLFSAFTHAPEEPASTLDKDALLYLHRLREEFHLDIEDVRILLARFPAPGLLVHHHYGAKSAVDDMQARHIADVPGVRSFPAAHDRHDALGWLRARGRLDAAIARFLADLPAP